MSTQKLLYGSWSPFTCTLASLANNAARQSSVVDNSSNLWLDVLVGGGPFKTGAGNISSTAAVNVWAFGLTDGANYGGTYGPQTLGGGDAAFTMPANTGNLRLLAVVPINGPASGEFMQPVSLAFAFGGNLPQKFGIIVQNQTGLPLDATSPGSGFYLPIQMQSV